MTLSNLPGTLSQTKYAGSAPIPHGAVSVTSGTMTRARMPAFRPSAFSNAGTYGIGSFFHKPGGTTVASMGVMPNGRFWDSGSGGATAFLLGTKPLSAGTNTRLGTTLIGSCKFSATVRAIAPSAIGHVWFGVGQYMTQIGTLALRNGTNSRIGTRLIGSFKTPSANIVGGAFSPRGELWIATAGSYVSRLGTLGLRAGTNSRIGTTAIGSFRSVGTSLSGLGIDRLGQIWGNPTGRSYLYRFGTVALRGGTNSRQGTADYGSIGPSSGRLIAVAFDNQGRGFMSVHNNRWHPYLGTIGVSHSRRRYLDQLQPPPATGLRFVVVNVRLSPSALVAAGASLAQSGTLAHVERKSTAPTTDLQVHAFVRSTTGSYVLRKTTSATASVLNWLEYAP